MSEKREELQEQVDKNDALFVDGRKKIEDSTLVALTLVSGSLILQVGKIVGAV